MPATLIVVPPAGHAIMSEGTVVTPIKSGDASSASEGQASGSGGKVVHAADKPITSKPTGRDITDIGLGYPPPIWSQTFTAPRRAPDELVVDFDVSAALADTVRAHASKNVKTMRLQIRGRHSIDLGPVLDIAKTLRPDQTIVVQWGESDG